MTAPATHSAFTAARLSVVERFLIDMTADECRAVAATTDLPNNALFAPTRDEFARALFAIAGPLDAPFARAAK